MILKQHSDGRTSFTDIGRNYNVVKREQDDFAELFSRQLGDDKKDAFKDVYAFLVYDGGASCQPLYQGCHYYVLSEGGRLFDTLTFR